MNDNISKYSQKLKSTIGTTIGSRFISSRTLSTQSQLSITSISFLSVYAIAIAIIQNTLDSTRQCANLNNLYTLLSILLSVFILVLSLLEGTKNYQLRAERLHNNAKELSKLDKEIEYLEHFCLGNDDIHEKLNNIKDQYNDLIDRCPENHNSDDYWLFKEQQKIKDFNYDYWLFKKAKNIKDSNDHDKKNSDDEESKPKYLTTIGWIWENAIYLIKHLWFLIKHFWLYILFIFAPIPLFIWLYDIFKCT